MDTWPISTVTHEGWAFIGIPDRLGDGGPLPRKAAPPEVNQQELREVVVRRRILQQTVLSIVPANQREAQEMVMKWAGADTEEIPEFIWTAPDEAGWNLDVVAEYCAERNAWADMNLTVRQPAERLVVMFDNQVSCACPVGRADEVRNHLSELANRWSLRSIPGPSEYAWVASARSAAANR